LACRMGSLLLNFAQSVQLLLLILACSILLKLAYSKYALLLNLACRMTALLLNFAYSVQVLLLILACSILLKLAYSK